MIFKELIFTVSTLGGVAVLTELILTIPALGGCCGLERPEF